MHQIKLSVLILGGTSFLGPHLVHEFQDSGHQVTLFNRGSQSNTFVHVEELRGDRDGALQALQSRNWDVVIDTSGLLPRVVEASSKILANATKHYIYLSSISVYKDFISQGIDEDYPLLELQDKTTEAVTDETFGALKASSEKIILDYFPNRALIIRPGLIVGPLDNTKRFSYWPLRMLKEGNMLAPGAPNQSVQFIDVRDLAKWIVKTAEKRLVGIYNATGPETPLSFEKLLHVCQEVTKNNVDITWVDEDFLITHQVQDWIELPLWLSYKRNRPGFGTISIHKARNAGLIFRPLSETIIAILEEAKINKAKNEKIGLDPEKEQMILKSWKQRKIN